MERKLGIGGKKTRNRWKEIISKRIGVPYEEIEDMKLDETIQYIEQKTGKKFNWGKCKNRKENQEVIKEDIDNDMEI